MKEPNPQAQLGADLTAFHQGLHGAHGNLACVSCHNPAEGYGSLRLADGKSLPYAEVMHLCAQCHGPQYRDYQHGAHGGMTGYWDLSKGGRTRANCIDCHNPHTPKYQPVQPAKGPNDRGSAKEKESGHRE
jgi:formate-dependent nitrite reductase cytochrome c552 subunit